MTAVPSVLQLIVHDLSDRIGLSGLCAGYERGSWRAQALADELLESLPDFCLTFSEYQSLTHETAVKVIRQAARRVFETEKFKNRGEFGELLLHLILKKVMQTTPAISKIFYKDSANDTVKGFDAVHVVNNEGQLQLWLGEVKFYQDAIAGFRDVSQELQKHSESRYLRSEFYAIKNKIDSSWPFAEKLEKLLQEETSLDEVFDVLCVPVLVTYDGETTSRYTDFSEQYKKELTEEFTTLWRKFSNSSLPKDLKIHLFLVPLATKEVLLNILDQKLKAWQSL